MNNATTVNNATKKPVSLILGTHLFIFNGLPSGQPFSKGCREQRPESATQRATFHLAELELLLVMTINGSAFRTNWFKSSLFSLRISSLIKRCIAASRILHLAHTWKEEQWVFLDHISKINFCNTVPLPKIFSYWHVI